MDIVNFIPDTRRSHALEHATIQILNRRVPSARLAGRSLPGGFVIYGDVPADVVCASAQEGLARLKGGAHHLAVHARCGTNLVTAGAAVGLVSFLTMLPGDEHSRRQRLPLLLLLSTLTLLFVQPLGPLVQQYITTQSDLEQTQIVAIDSRRWWGVWAHRVRLAHRTGR